MPLQAAEANLCDQRDCASAVRRVGAAAVEQNLAELELLAILVLASKPIAVSQLCWKWQVSPAGW